MKVSQFSDAFVGSLLYGSHKRTNNGFHRPHIHVSHHHAPLTAISEWLPGLSGFPLSPPVYFLSLSVPGLSLSISN